MYSCPSQCTVISVFPHCSFSQLHLPPGVPCFLFSHISLETEAFIPSKWVYGLQLNPGGDVCSSPRSYGVPSVTTGCCFWGFSSADKFYISVVDTEAMGLHAFPFWVIFLPSSQDQWGRGAFQDLSPTCRKVMHEDGIGLGMWSWRTSHHSTFSTLDAKKPIT